MVAVNNQLAQHTLLPLSEQITRDAQAYSVRALRTSVGAAALVVLGSMLFAAFFSRSIAVCRSLESAVCQTRYRRSGRS